jgi:hypothetical protein
MYGINLQVLVIKLQWAEFKQHQRNSIYGEKIIQHPITSHNIHLPLMVVTFS